jgi:ADP-ribose pyrophosphatase YjhB (NUDIX family)
MELGEKVSKMKKMEHISAGLLVICNEKILLVQQANDIYKEHLSIPKGQINKNEKPLDAAVRETYEETGLKIEKKFIRNQPYLMNIDSNNMQRRIIYYIAIIKQYARINIQDKDEIKWAGFLNYMDAEKRLQITQLSVLLHLDSNHLSNRAMNWLCQSGYVTCEEHYEAQLRIYNYDKKCKVDQYWDEITQWARGLITDAENNILYYPIKKFFELNQMYRYLIPNGNKSFKLYEKKDGALGILYWHNGYPYIATRGSFVSQQAILGTHILYKYHYEDFKNFNKKYTYFFEIISPQDKHVVDYGNEEDLFLIGAYDNVKGIIISSDEIDNLSFKKVKRIKNHINRKELLKIDNPNEEGFVALYDDGTRLKIKFNNYKIKHAQIFK